MEKRKKEKIIKNIIVFFLIILAYLPLLVFGQDVRLDNPAKHSTVVDFLISVRNFLWILVAPLSSIMMIWAGILFLTSEGNPDRIRKAKTLVTYIIVGIFVALIATGIVQIIKSL